MKKKYTIKEIMKFKSCYLMILPFMILFCAFIVLPIISSFVLSFTNFNMLEIPKFAGFDNYIRLFLDDDIFLIAIRNTLIFALITGPLGYIACLIFAWLINELGPRLRAILTFVFYAPSISGTLFIMWALIFSGDQYGYLNYFLSKLGIIDEPVQWLNNPDTMLIIIIIVQIWMSLGASFLAFIAGLQSIDRQLYEAAAVDGVRNRWQELFLITLPSMGPQLLFGAVMQISATFAVSSICIALAGFPSTDYAALTIVSHIMDYGTIRFELGYASALSFILFVFIIAINSVIQAVIRKYADS